MSKGYICIAQNTNQVNYLEQAYALAMNLHLTQSSVNKLSVCVDSHTLEQIEDKHRLVFDQIIEIPWGDLAEHEKKWKIQNKWKYLHMTPYEETVILDTDMLFPTDVSYWWDSLREQDVWATTDVRTYRNEIVTDDHYRKCFTSNNLPNVYTAFLYFKKSSLTSDLFSMTEIIFQHWQRFFFDYLPGGNKPTFLSGDVAFALAMQLLGIESDCTRINVSTPTFVHMKSYIQGIAKDKIQDDWTESLPTYYVSYRDFKIGNFQQLLPFHYTEKHWLNQEMIQQLEQDYYEQSS